jgi:cytochrome c-type biogenesis protein CcmF
LAFSQSKIISQNTSGIAMGDNSLNNENQVLIQNHPMPMGKYFVVYKDSEIKGKHVFYNLDFYTSRPDSLSKFLFRLSPSININPRMGNVHEPSTKHFIDKDIYVYITFADVQSVLGGSRYSLLHQQEMKKGDTLRANGNKIVLDNLKVESYSDKKFNARITAYYTFINAKGKKQKQDVSYIVDGDSVAFSDRFCREDGLKIRFEKVSDIPQHIVLGIYEKNPEYIVVKAIIFPNILVVWIGAFITFAGIAYALLRRIWKKGK